jgi:D-alanyl-D-alanine carboxypeptidase/D-alanyl-D-alanine-endopeptidase (penicillin-binding protein 4)
LAAWAERTIFSRVTAHLSNWIPTLRRHLLLPLLVVFAVAAPLSAPAAQAPLQYRLDRALAVPHVDRSQAAAVAIDLGTGEVLYERNAARALAPASTEKLTLSYALLVRLGPAYRIHTDLLADGAAEGATWRGNLVVKGYGDPTLTKWDLRGLARSVSALGIRRVTGSVLADESYYDARRVGRGWKPSYYVTESAPLSALVVDRARVRGRTSTRPALAAAEKLRGALKAYGVSVVGGVALGRASPDAARIGRTSSAPLARILHAVNGDSDNFTAEMLLKHLGAAVQGKGTSAAGATAVMDALREAGIPLDGVRIVDGSGLSLLDRLTVRALADLLSTSWQDPALRGIFLATLAVSGRRGTLEDRLRGRAVAGRVFAKTGTTSRASALAGYVNGRYAFAILQNGSPVSWWWARYAQDRFVKVLATTPAG